MLSVRVQQVTTRRDLRAFVRFPWQVYRSDPNWVPPLIADRMAYLDPDRGPYYRHADIALYLARRGREVVGTVAAFKDRRPGQQREPGEAGFGFFEVVDDPAVAEPLLDAACAWLWERGATVVCGPFCFSGNEYPGVLVEGADCPPVMLQAHSPSYYVDLLERYGMEKDHDLYAYRAFRQQVGSELENLPPELHRVADAARRAAGVTLRKLRLDDWDSEIATACTLFNETLRHYEDFVPVTEREFARLAGEFRPFIDPDLAVIAEADGQPVGFCVALPDINRVLIRLNGRLSPLNWLRIRRYIREIDVVSFKLMGVLDAYRRRGIDALLYLEVLKGFYEKGYEWLDGSVTSETNLAVNLLATRLGAERYKRFRVYRLELGEPQSAPPEPAVRPAPDAD